MPRAVWRGTISFGLVAIPVRLHVATDEGSSVPLHLLCTNDGTRLRNLRWCPTENREIPWDEVVRGYEIAKGEHVVLTRDDLESLPLRTTHTIEILQFCAREEVPDLYLDRAYYVEPEDVGRRPYTLLRTALERSGRVGIGKIALRDREHLARIGWIGETLVLETLLWPEQIRDAGELDVPSGVTPHAAEVDMATMLVDALVRPFDPGEYRDEYRAALLRLVEERKAGREVERPEAPAAPEKVIDLMEALRASVEAARARGTGTG